MRSFVLQLLYYLGVYRRFRIHLSPLLAEPPCSVPVERGILGADDIREYLELRPDQDRAEVERRLAAGHRCFVGRHAGRMVVAGWLGAGRVPLEFLGCTLRLAMGTGYSYDDFVAPELRGKRVLGLLIHARSSFAIQHGYRRIVGIVLPQNRSSYLGILRRKRIWIGAIERFQLGRWRHHRLRFDPEHVGLDAPPFTVDPWVWPRPNNRG